MPVSDGELDRGRHPGVHAMQRGAPAHRAYPATCTQVALRRGLDGVLSAALARPAGHPGWHSDGR
jgi:hypothetical protein